MDYQTYGDYIRSITPGPSWVDHLGNPATSDMWGQFVTVPTMLGVKAQLEKDLGVVATPTIDSQWRSSDDRQRWMLTFPNPDGGQITAAVGVLFGESSQPYGWTDADKRNFYIGVGAPGRYDWDPAGNPSSDGLPVAWIPGAKPAPPQPVRDPSLTTYAQLTNASVVYDREVFTAADRALLQRIGQRLQVL